MKTKQNKVLNCSIELDHLAKVHKRRRNVAALAPWLRFFGDPRKRPLLIGPRLSLVFFFILLVLVLLSSSSTLIYTLTGRHGCRQFVERCRGLHPSISGTEASESFRHPADSAGVLRQLSIKRGWACWRHHYSHIYVRFE